LGKPPADGELRLRTGVGQLLAVGRLEILILIDNLSDNLSDMLFA
jgi:hypothetical protein